MIETSTLPVTLEWIRGLDKAELHLHLLGAIRPLTAHSLAAKYGVPLDIPLTSWTTTFSSGTLSDFVMRFIRLFELARETEDFEQIAGEVFEDLAGDGIRYAEPRITLTSHLSRGVSLRSIRDGLESARKYALDHLNLEIGWIVDFPRIQGESVGRRALEEAIHGKAWGVVGFDIAGDEIVTPYDDWLVSLFRDAHAAGLGTTAHAGETGPAENIWTALRDWKVGRIGHGLHAMDDRELIHYLADRQIPLEVCPTSNWKLAGITSLSDHPLDRFRKAGIPVTVNTDDPSLFGITLSEELMQVASVFGWDRTTVMAVVETAWNHRFALSG